MRIGLAVQVPAERLAGLRSRLGAAASGWPLLVADSADQELLAALARAARVVATTVGPYRRHGLALVEACVTAGTAYADLSGEMLFRRDSIDRYHQLAASTGVRIVHCCGFDCVPSDLGVLLLHRAARADDAGDLEDTTLVVTALRGGVEAGGTPALGTGQWDEGAGQCRAPQAGSRTRMRSALTAGPSLTSATSVTRRGPATTRIWVFGSAHSSWLASTPAWCAAATPWRAGRTAAGSATARSPGSALARPRQPWPPRPLPRRRQLAAGLAFGPSRALLSPFLPSPGEGPSEKTRRQGYFRIQIHTRTSTGVRYVSHVEARGDPGYAATAVMLGESALCLALDNDRLPDRAGV